MGYLTAKQFSQKWGISERRILKLCKEERIPGAIKNGMVWEIPEETLKPFDKRSKIYQDINTQKRILIVNIQENVKKSLLNLLEKEGYLTECREFQEIENHLDKLEKYYEGLIYFQTNHMDKREEAFVIKFSEKLNAESSIVIIEDKKLARNQIENKLADQLKSQIGIKINTLLLTMPKNKEIVVDYDEIAQDIVTLLIRLKNTTGIAITTDGGMVEFGKTKKTEKLAIGQFYRVINQYFKNLNQGSYLWCASIMLADEWTDSPQEMKFRVINLEAANRGVKIERIFIFPKSRIKEFKKNKTLKLYMQSNMKTLFVDYDEIQEKNPKLLELVGNGWDGIDKDTLIVDLPEESKERGYVSKNTTEVMEAYNCFQELKKYASDLKEMLKGE